MRIAYLTSAIWDLTEIRSHIAANHPDAAQQTAQRLVQSINRLATFPNLGKPGRKFGTRELMTPEIGRTAYIVIYRVKSDEVQILRVLPGTRDIDSILEEGFTDEEN